VSAQPWPIGQHVLAAVKEEPSLQPSSAQQSFVQQGYGAAGGFGGRQQPQRPRQQQQQRQRPAVNDEYGRSKCFCKGCVIC
jgi:hypothetical protein